MNRPPLPFSSRNAQSHKGNFGRVLLIGGSRGMSGSIALSAIAALKTGSGLVSAAIPDRCLETVAGFHPGVMTIAMPDTDQGRFSVESAAKIHRTCRGQNAIGIGPGMTTDPGSVALVARVLSMTSIPRVVDADAINLIAAEDLLKHESKAGPLVLTPHPGELARLTGVPASDRPGQIDAANQLAEQHSMVIVVKGGPTVVVSPADADTVMENKSARWQNDTGNPGMATAGSGDVLTGVITSLLGQGLSPRDSAILGVWLHGRAGDIAADRHGQSGMTCWELLQAIPMATHP